MGAAEAADTMRQSVRAIVAAFAVIICALSTSAMADDWVATKLRGTVLQLVDGEWVKLKRGDVVPDDRVIRTLRTGNVQFKRDRETIDLGPQTQVQIFDKSGKRFTTVKQYFGAVTVEAEVQNVQHFAVQTPHLAAVVKGTKFTVVSGKDAAEVQVRRGHVAVEDTDNHQTVTVAAGQSVTATEGQSLDVAGKGQLPVVHNADGTPVVTVEIADRDSGKGKDKSKDAVSTDTSNGVSVAGVSANAGGNNGNGNGNSNAGSGNNGNGNSGSENNGNGNGNGNGNSGSGGNGHGKKDN